MRTREFLFHWVIICCYYYLFWCSNCPRLASVSPFRVASVSFWWGTISFWALPYFLAWDFSGSSYILPVPSSGIKLSPRILVPSNGESKVFALNSLLFTSCLPEMVGIDFKERVRILNKQVSQESLGHCWSEPRGVPMVWRSLEKHEFFYHHHHLHHHY